VKSSLRSEFLSKRKLLDADFCKSAHWYINLKLQELLTDLKSEEISGFIALENEVDIMPTLVAFERKGICLPYLKGKEEIMKFSRWKPGEPLIKLYGFFQTEVVVDAFPKTIILPMVLGDIKGNRIGYGKGHYDKALAYQETKHLIGVCYDDFITEAIPSEPHDIRLHYIVTEKRIIKCQL
jgi:5-formyltetrahydrofolate cyclo-ligase